jgi:sugar/nucleoside kinase (ribokinase family)
LDTVETPSGYVSRAPGGSALYFGLAARFFSDVAVAGVLGEDYPGEVLEELASAGVDTGALERRPGESFRWHVRYDSSGERHTVDTNRGVALGAAPSVPPELRDPDGLFLGSTDPGVQQRVLDAAGVPGFLAVDTMAHWIQDRRPGLDGLLAVADLLFATDEEVRLLGGDDPEDAVQSILADGVDWVVVKRGADGATAHGVTGRVAVPATVPTAVIDPTGAGDAFAGGVLGALVRRGELDTEAMAEALRYGSVLGALAVESFSYGAILSADAGEVEARAAELGVRLDG